MFFYMPPKSQIWGHRVGRLSSVEILERSTRFLDELTNVIGSTTQKFRISYREDALEYGTAAVGAASKLIAAAPGSLNRFEGWDGIQYDITWTLITPDELKPLATWLDTLGNRPIDQFSANAECHINFNWKSTAADPSPTSGQNMFTVRLGRSSVLMTMFGFDSLEHFEQVKKYLSGIDLCVLSDKHLRPMKVREPKGKAKSSSL
jgi:hypothetical protein